MPSPSPSPSPSPVTVTVTYSTYLHKLHLLEQSHDSSVDIALRMCCVDSGKPWVHCLSACTYLHGRYTYTVLLWISRLLSSSPKWQHKTNKEFWFRLFDAWDRVYSIFWRQSLIFFMSIKYTLFFQILLFRMNLMGILGIMGFSFQVYWYSTTKIDRSWSTSDFNT